MLDIQRFPPSTVTSTKSLNNLQISTSELKLNNV
jgi:hypothetical protein